jgi:hypothetical protein
LSCLTVLAAELGDFSAQDFDFRHPIQAQQFAPTPRAIGNGSAPANGSAPVPKNARAKKIDSNG